LRKRQGNIGLVVEKEIGCPQGNTVNQYNPSGKVVFAEKFLFFQIGPFRSSVRLMAYNPGTVFFIPHPGCGQIYRIGR
jgi:hypothetical protein